MRDSRLGGLPGGGGLGTPGPAVAWEPRRAPRRLPPEASNDGPSVEERWRELPDASYRVELQRELSRNGEMSNKKPIYKKTLDQTQGGPSQTMATTRGAPALDRAGNVATQWGAAPDNQSLWEGSDPGRKIGVAGGDGTEQVTGMPTWRRMPISRLKRRKETQESQRATETRDVGRA